MQLYLFLVSLVLLLLMFADSFSSEDGDGGSHFHSDLGYFLCIFLLDATDRTSMIWQMQTARFCILILLFFMHHLRHSSIGVFELFIPGRCRSGIFVALFYDLIVENKA